MRELADADKTPLPAGAYVVQTFAAFAAAVVALRTFIGADTD
jgi:hypothetical protein